jgi:hypothetical protein
MSNRQALPQLRYHTKFRPYQRHAINMVRRYMSEFHQVGPDFGAALVCHPTGSGKTAVMVGLAHAAPEIRNTLILTTREAIRDQLVRELSGNIFIDQQKFNLSTRIRLPKIPYAITESRLLYQDVRAVNSETKSLLFGDVLAFANTQFNRLNTPDRAFLSELASSPSIILMTVQMLVGLEREQGPAYEALQKHIDLIVFDEGHYEPAAKYSVAVRNLQRPIALLSATPFRNDLKPFKVHANNIHVYRFADAVSDGIVRNVNVVQRSPTRNLDTFCDDLIAFCETSFGADRGKWPRIIIHCDDMGGIVRLAERFIDNGFEGKVIGIHDRFVNQPDRKSWQYREVPPPKTTNALIWIHQYKLLEGIDDHRFQVLAFFDLLRNVRSIVQQIGRVIRITPGSSSHDAIVLDHYGGRLLYYWNTYLSYDRSISKEYFTKTFARFYIDKFTEIQPEIDYINRKFRHRLDLRHIVNIKDEILFQRRAILKRISSKATLEDFTTLMEEALTDEDFEFARYDVDDTTVIYVCAKVETPDFFNNLYFAEPRHGARIIHIAPKHRLLVTSSTGGGTGAEGLGHLESVLPSELECLLMPGPLGRVSSVSSLNTNLGNRVVRRRTISAPSIADVPPILDEYGHILSTVTGYNGTEARIVDDVGYLETIDEEMNIVVEQGVTNSSITTSGLDIVRRYIGLSSGRLSETGPPLRVVAYLKWVNSLANQMKTGGRYTDVYNRYAAISSGIVDKGAARNVLFDFMDVSDHYHHKDTGDNMRSDDLCVERTGRVVRSSGKLTSNVVIRVNEKDYTVEVAFSHDSQRYRIDSPQLDIDFIRTDGRSISLCRALNEAQSFNIIPDDTRLIYVHGKFYAPGLKFGSRFSAKEFFVGHCLYPSDVFKNLKSEKGGYVVNGGDGYAPDSLFGLIDNWKGGFDSDTLSISSSWVGRYRPESINFLPDLCICDDTNKETADFILADSITRRVVLIHAKASKKFREYSASAVQEVCAQAQKNTSLFATYSLQPPGNLGIWGKEHNFIGDEKATLVVARRIRKPIGCEAMKAWDMLLGLLLNPLTTREIWIVLGNMLSSETFYKGMESEDPPPESLQLNHLLQTTIAAAGSVGAKTRIFCAP